MTSKITSEMKVTTILGVLSWVLSTTQLLTMGLHSDRSCRTVQTDKPRLSKLVSSEILLLTRTIPDKKPVFLSDPKVCREKGLALDNDHKIGRPHSSCEPHNKLIFVPYSKTGGSDKRFGWENRNASETWKETYMRKIIKAEAQTRPT